MCSTYPRFPLSVPNAHPFANFARPSDEAPRSPWDLYRSYGLKPDMDAGSGVTVAIVVAFGSPTLQRDFDEFNRYFGLPAAEVEIRYSGAEPSVIPENWQIETTADVCWLHAAAPGAKLLSVFASGADISGAHGSGAVRGRTRRHRIHELRQRGIPWTDRLRPTACRDWKAIRRFLR